VKPPQAAPIPPPGSLAILSGRRWLAGEPAVTFPTASMTIPLALDDVDGDGLPDLALFTPDLRSLVSPNSRWGVAEVRARETAVDNRARAVVGNFSSPVSEGALLFHLAAVAAAATLHVGAGQPHPTLVGAVSAAVDGDVLVVHDASSSEQVVVAGKQLTLLSVAATRWSSSAPLRLEAGADVTVAGFVFDGVIDNAVHLTGGSRFEARYTSFLGQVIGIYVDDGDVVLSDVSFRDHVTYGTMLVVVRGTATLDRVEFVDNLSSEVAGLWVMADGQVDARSVQFVRNTSTVDGGGAVRCEGVCTFEDTRFVENGSLAGAAVWSTGTLQLTRAMVCENRSIAAVVSVFAGSAVLENVAFLDNYTSQEGLVNAWAPTTISHSTFVGNLSPFASALDVRSELNVSSTLFADNRSGNVAVWVDPNQATVTDSWNAWYRNAGGNANGPVDPSDLVGQDPLLPAGGGCSWRRVVPGVGSPLLDAGAPGTSDPDGSRADIGATGGPASAF
jgi:predicted outer membrane repeat protein